MHSNAMVGIGHDSRRGQDPAVDSPKFQSHLDPMAKAKDVMTPNPLMIPTAMDILDAVEFFNRHQFNSAPVQNPMGEILGQMTEMDLVKALVHYKANGDFCKVAHAQKYFDPVFFVEENDELVDVLKTMVRSPTNRVLVRTPQERIVGIISPRDLLKIIHGEEKRGQEILGHVQDMQIELNELKTRMTEMSRYIETYDTVFQSGLFGLHSADREGKIVFANQRLHEILKYSPGELLGRSIFELYPPEFHGEARAGLKRIMETGTQQLTFSAMINRANEHVRVDLASAALKDELGQFVGTFTISRPHDELGADGHPIGFFQSAKV